MLRNTEVAPIGHTLSASSAGRIKGTCQGNLIAESLPNTSSALPYGSSNAPLEATRGSQPAAIVERLAYSIAEIAAGLGIGRRTLEREIAAGRFPKADFYIGRLPRWRSDTVLDWIERGGRC
jgi:excisionase family DNA binding protein